MNVGLGVGCASGARTFIIEAVCTTPGGVSRTRAIMRWQRTPCRLCLLQVDQEARAACPYNSTQRREPLPLPYL